MNQPIKKNWLILPLCGILLLLTFKDQLNHWVKNDFSLQEEITNSNDCEMNGADRMREKTQEAGFDETPSQLVFIGLKEERLLEVYGFLDGCFEFITSYPFTAFSGEIGPKLAEGDKQIPEGIYGIEYFNPNSKFHLSMKVTYPNDFDQSKTNFANVRQMGGDIFIHGKDVTIGCIPLGDQAIEELYSIATDVGKENIKVIISPRDFRVNKTFPVIDNIDWETELYEMISKELAIFGSQ